MGAPSPTSSYRQSDIGTQARVTPQLRVQPFAWLCTIRACTTRVTAALQLLAWCPGPWLALLGRGIEDEHFPQLLLCFFPLLRSQFQDWQADSTQVLSRPFRGDSEALPMLLSNGQTWAAAATVFQKPRDVCHLACPLLLSLPVVSLHWATGGGRMIGTLLFCLC